MFRGAFVSMPPEWRAPVSDRRGKAGSRPGSGGKPPPPLAPLPPFGVRPRRGAEPNTTPLRRTVALAALALLAFALLAALWRSPEAGGRRSANDSDRRLLLDGLPPGALAVAFPPAVGATTSSPPPQIQDSALRAFAALCAAGRETYVVMDRKRGRAFSSRSIEALGVLSGAAADADADAKNAAALCPLADVMLAGADRSLGLCTDAAIYAWLLGARLLPLGAPLGRYAREWGGGGGEGGGAKNKTNPCASHPAPARLSLEPLYARWVLREELGEAGGLAGSGAEAFAREGGGMGASGDGGSAQEEQRQQRQQGRKGALLRRPRGRRRAMGWRVLMSQQHRDENATATTTTPPPLPPLLPAANNAPPRWWSPNPENQPLADRDLHARMDAVLCKTRACERMMAAYTRDLASEVASEVARRVTAAAPADATAAAEPPPPPAAALVLFAGHTSLDPLDAASARSTPLIARAPGRRPPADLPPEEEEEEEEEGADAREAAAVAALLGPPTLPQLQPEPSSSSSSPLLLAAEQPEPLRALHVRGKSGLKHTAELLACWYGKRAGGGGGGGGGGGKAGGAKAAAAAKGAPPDWPELDVVGPLPNPQVPASLARLYLAANIRLPLLSAAGGARSSSASSSAPSPPASFASVAALQRRSAVHVCPSEREGFGHYANEARAAGALVVASAHAPLDELVWEEGDEGAGTDAASTNATGVLIRPLAAGKEGAYFSQEGPPVPALGRYANLSVRLSPADVCAGVSRALALPAAERARRGRAARAAFLAQRRALERRFFSVLGDDDNVRGVLWRQLVEAAGREPV